jgi:hypothetical protein
MSRVASSPGSARESAGGLSLIPPGTTVRSLIERIAPDLHGQLVADGAPSEPYVVTVRIDGAGSWTVHIRGREMRVAEGEAERPTLWLFTTTLTVERFLEDAAGPGRFLPRFEPGDGAAVLSDPRIVKRVAMAHGRIELALTDDDGERLAIVMGFGHATRKPIDPDDADVVVETGAATIARIVEGTLPPEDALGEKDVKVRGNRMLALQLALAVAPFYPKATAARGSR